MRFGLKYVWHETPPAAHSIANAIAWGFGSGGALTALLTPFPKTGAIIAIFGGLAKAISNFSAVDSPDDFHI